jgi:hypothetical protein
MGVRESLASITAPHFPHTFLYEPRLFAASGTEQCLNGAFLERFSRSNWLQFQAEFLV